MMSGWVVMSPKRSIRKSKWSTEEDAKLRSAVEKFGTESWIRICSFVPGRTGKQCRERWIGQLAPEVTKKHWSQEEDAELIRSHALNGNKWTTIALTLPGRSAISVKNRWNWLIRHNMVSGHDLDTDSGPDIVEEVKTTPGQVFEPLVFNDSIFGVDFQLFQQRMMRGVCE